MSQVPGNRPPAREPWQLSTRGLFVLAFGIAVGLTEAKTSAIPWADGPLAAAAAWSVCGLLVQVADLRFTLRENSSAASELRCGWRFGIGWRVGLSLLLVTHYVVEYLLQRGTITLFNVTWFDEAMPKVLSGSSEMVTARDGLVYLTFVLLLASSSGLAPSTPSGTIWSRCLAVLGVMAGGMCCLLVWSNQTTVHFLVYLATTGGLWRLSPPMAEAQTASTWLRYVFAAVFLGLLATATAYRLLRSRETGPRPGEPDWRRRHRLYYHEHPGVMATLVLASSVYVLHGVPWHLGLEPLIWNVAVRPDNYLVAAVLLLSTRGLLISSGWKRERIPQQPPTMWLPGARFGIVWLGVFVTLTAAGVALAWLSFAIWLTPWYRL